MKLNVLVATLSLALTAAPAPAQPESTRWGLPVDRLRYSISNFQRITMQQRLHMKQ